MSAFSIRSVVVLEAYFAPWDVPVDLWADHIPSRDFSPLYLYSLRTRLDHWLQRSEPVQVYAACPLALILEVNAGLVLLHLDGRWALS